MDLTDLVTQYKEEGFEAVQEKVESWNKEYYYYRQIQFVLDRCRGLSIDIENTHDRINNKYGYYLAYKGKQKQRQLLPEANKVNKKLLDSLSMSRSLIDKAINEADSSLFHLRNQIEDELRM